MNVVVLFDRDTVITRTECLIDLILNCAVFSWTGLLLKMWLTVRVDMQGFIKLWDWSLSCPDLCLSSILTSLISSFHPDFLFFCCHKSVTGSFRWRLIASGSAVATAFHQTYGLRINMERIFKLTGIELEWNQSRSLLCAHWLNACDWWFIIFIDVHHSEFSWKCLLNSNSNLEFELR